MTFKSKTTHTDREHLRSLLENMPYRVGVMVRDLLEDYSAAWRYIQELEAQIQEPDKVEHAMPTDPDSNPEWLKKELGE